MEGTDARGTMTVPRCFFCGQPKDNVAILGPVPTGAGGAPNPVVELEPCRKCRETMGKGCTLLGTSVVPVVPHQPASTVREDGTPRYLTGNAVTLPDAMVRRLFEYGDAERIVEARTAYVSDEIIRYLHTVLEPAPGEAAGTD